MVQTEKKRDFKVLAEKIAPDNVLIMAELLAIKETKTLVSLFNGRHVPAKYIKNGTTLLRYVLRTDETKP